MYVPRMEHDSPRDQRPKSRSQLKREASALQRMGEELAALGDETLRKAPLPPDLKDALMEARAMTSHEARRRQMQYVGKVMRTVDTAEVEAFLERHRQGKSRADKAHQQLEHWRDRLVEGDDDLLEELLIRFPGAERQRLRQLVLAARREREQAKPPKQFRALFRHLRELVEQN